MLIDYNDFMIRKAKLKDIDKIENLIYQAKDYLKKQNIDQWQDGYPNRETLLYDIEKGCSYILMQGQIIGTMYFEIADDPDYLRIDGKWLCEGRYGVIHRLALDDAYKGKSYAKKMLEYAIGICEKEKAVSIRIDTHEKNLSMRRFLEKNGFIECGVIYIRGISPRIAYEYVF